jgi:chorismate-pyruvate lyase
MSFLNEISDFDLSSIELLQRMLLVTDGTLTDLLQVAFLEPIGVLKLKMDVGKTSMPVEPLELKAGEVRMERSILLYGQNTDKNYVYAESTLAIDRLPARLREQLIGSNKPIGRLWSEHEIETRKELLHVSKCSPSKLLPYFVSTAASNLLLRRSYRLVTRKQPVIIITEYFPDSYKTSAVSSQCGVTHFA